MQTWKFTSYISGAKDVKVNVFWVNKQSRLSFLKHKLRQQSDVLLNKDVK